MAPLQAKIGWKMQRKTENKNFHSVPFRFYPTCNRKFQKNSKKIEKTKQYHYGFISSQNRLEKAEKEKKLKIIVPFRSVPTQRVIGNYKKNSQKIRKTKQYHYGFISSQNRLENAEK